MKKILLILLVSLAFKKTEAQMVIVHFQYYSPKSIENADTVFYSSRRPLNWKDFSGTPAKGSSSSAVSFSSFSIDMTGREKNKIANVFITLHVYFVKSDSWVKRGEENNYALAHEQLHFDIAKICAEMFRRKVLSENLTLNDYDSEINFIYWEAYRKMNVMQENYDEETKHGMDKSTQQTWQKKVGGLLKSFENGNRKPFH